MDNISKLIDDSSASMYFSFNSTAACKTAENTNNDTSMAIEDEDDCGQNNTLEAGCMSMSEVDEMNNPVEEIQTIKKLSIGIDGISPHKSLAKNIMRAYKTLSSTPTKAQLLRSVDVNRGSAPVVVDVSDLGVAFLEAPQESISSVTSSEDKENQRQESQEIYSETSSEIVTIIEKTQEDLEKPIKGVGFSNLPVLKSSSNLNHIRKSTPKVPKRSIPRCEPDISKNRPSRISTSKRISLIPKSSTDVNSEEIPKMLKSILKISKGLPTPPKSLGVKQEKPFNLLGKATRMSIVKTTLNSPARKVSRKSIAAPVHVSAATSRKSIVPSASRKSLMPSSVSITSPRKRIVAINSRKSMITAVASSSSAVSSRKSLASKVSLASNFDSAKQKTATTTMKPPSALKKDLICDVCSRKFLVLSLFETHKKSHLSSASTSTSLLSSSSTSTSKPIFSSNDNKCRYCDKKFAISKALYNHLIEKCPKIPPGDKKKLLFPSLSNNGQSKLPPKSMSDLSSCDSLASNSTQTSRSSSSVKKNSDAASGAPSSTTKLKKKVAHSGVYCTPNKNIICHVCKTSFNNILAFTEHKLTHSTANTNQSEEEVNIADSGLEPSKSDGSQEVEEIEIEITGISVAQIIEKYCT